MAAPDDDRIAEHGLEPIDLRVLVRRGREHVFIDEALLRHRAAKRQNAVVLGVAGAGEQRGAQRRENELELGLAGGDRLQHAEQHGVVADRGETGAAEQLIRRQPVRPGRDRPPHGLADRRQYGGERFANAVELLEQLRHQRERTRETRGGFGALALRQQHEAEIVAGLGVIGLEQQQALVGARGVVKLVLALEALRLREQLGRTGAIVPGRRALLGRGATLFSIHPSKSRNWSPSAGRIWRRFKCRLFKCSFGVWIARSGLTRKCRKHKPCRTRSCGRVAEGGGLLNRYTLQRRIEGSNPSGSATANHLKKRKKTLWRTIPSPVPHPRDMSARSTLDSYVVRR